MRRRRQKATDVRTHVELISLPPSGQDSGFSDNPLSARCKRAHVCGGLGSYLVEPISIALEGGARLSLVTCPASPTIRFRPRR